MVGFSGVSPRPVVGDFVCVWEGCGGEAEVLCYVQCCNKYLLVGPDQYVSFGANADTNIRK